VRQRCSLFVGRERKKEDIHLLGIHKHRIKKAGMLSKWWQELLLALSSSQREFLTASDSREHGADVKSFLKFLRAPLFHTNK
jgi:hypothetical protein